MDSAAQQGEILTCAYAPDGKSVLSGGWDGHLRLWDALTRRQLTAVRAAPKPISACAVAPDGKLWVSGTMEGFLGCWNATTHIPTWAFLAHSRPISAIAFGNDSQAFATASWDGNVALWDVAQSRRLRTFTGHKDVVAGCRFIPGGKTLISWSYDGSLRIWDTLRDQCLATLSGHRDRVSSAGVSPDGRWAISGCRDGEVKLWDLRGGKQAASLPLPTEIRTSIFLADGETVLVVDAHGRVSLHCLPSLEPCTELETGFPIQCADMAPSGAELVLGSATGQVHFVAIEGVDSVPFLVTPTRAHRDGANGLQRLLGRKRVEHFLRCTCPACRHTLELANGDDSNCLPCPGCRRPLRIGNPV
jgi:WD40 repeat protein